MYSPQIFYMFSFYLSVMVSVVLYVALIRILKGIREKSIATLKRTVFCKAIKFIALFFSVLILFLLASSDIT